MGSLRFPLQERLAGAVDSVEPGKALPPADSGIDVTRIEFHTVANAAGSLRGKNGGSTSQEWIEHQIAAGCAIHNGLRYQGDRFHGGMERKQIAFAGRTGK